MLLNVSHFFFIVFFIYTYILFIIYYQNQKNLFSRCGNRIKIMLRCNRGAITVMEDLSNFLSRGDPGNLRNRA